jgi:S1-C subfamily serine protease
VIAVVAAVLVTFVLVGIRLLNHRGYRSQMGVYSRTRRGPSKAAIEQRRGQDAREALETLFRPESTIANSTVPRPLGIVFGATVDGGVVVASVVERSPAARAGVRAGAILTSVAGQRTADAAAVEQAIGQQIPGLGLPLTWTLDGVQHSAEVIL